MGGEFLPPFVELGVQPVWANRNAALIYPATETSGRERGA